MRYGRLWTDMVLNPKVGNLSHRTFRFWIGCIAACVAAESDGFVDKNMAKNVSSFAPRFVAQMVDELVDKKLAHKRGASWTAGFDLHDYLDWQDSKAQIEARRTSATANAYARHRHKDDANGTANGTADRTADGYADRSASRSRKSKEPSRATPAPATPPTDGEPALFGATEPEPPAPATAKPARARTAANDLWDELANILPGGAPTTKAGRGSWNAAIRDLLDAGATPTQLRAAARAWCTQHPEARFQTPTAIAKAWHTLPKGTQSHTTQTSTQSTSTQSTQTPEATRDKLLATLRDAQRQRDLHLIARERNGQDPDPNVIAGHDHYIAHALDSLAAHAQRCPSLYEPLPQPLEAFHERFTGNGSTSTTPEST